MLPLKPFQAIHFWDFLLIVRTETGSGAVVGDSVLTGQRNGKTVVQTIIQSYWRLLSIQLKPDIHNMRLDVTSLIIGVERSDFVKILDLKFLKFELNFEMLTWIFPNLGERFRDLGEILRFWDLGKVHVSFSKLDSNFRNFKPKILTKSERSAPIIKKVTRIFNSGGGKPGSPLWFCILSMTGFKVLSLTCSCQVTNGAWNRYLWGLVVPQLNFTTCGC